MRDARPMIRPRACGALILDNAIVMVLHREAHRTYWTLPGGGLEEGETFAEAAVREMFEETGLRTRTVKRLWADVYGAESSPEECYLLELGGAASDVFLGSDPEESHLSPADRLLQDAAWRQLGEVADDVQVARVMNCLGGKDRGLTFGE